MLYKLKQGLVILLCMVLVLTNISSFVYALPEDSNDIINISDSKGLMLIGSGVSSDGIEYSKDADYFITNDIPITYSELRSLDFSSFDGSISGSESEQIVYDEISNTIFIHNIYQLELTAGENEPVLSEDYDAAKIGVGQVFEDGEAGIISYDNSHNYVLTSDFTLERPKTKAEEILENEDTEESDIQEIADAEIDNAKGSMLRSAPLKAASINSSYPDEYNGRDYFGEVVRTIDGEDYILIGDQQQLRAIGTDKKVTEPVWKVYEEKTGTIITTWNVVDDSEDYPIEIYYPGDADLIKFSDDYNWSNLPLFDEDSGGHNLGSEEYLDGLTALGSTKRYAYRGSKLDNGELTYEESATDNTGIGNSAKYSYDANYIVFRDIFLTEDGTVDTSTVEWDPIDTFSGTMEGRLDMVEGDNPAINNVVILQDTAVDQSSYGLGDNVSEYGIGFFRSLTTPYDNVLSLSNDPIVVKNITLNDVSVDTTTTQIKQDFSLIGTLLTPVLNILGISSGEEKDPKSLSTGGFVGSVRGLVEISGCEITNLDHVSNVNDHTGGFVGISSGVTRYEALSGALNVLTNALSTLLNLVPALGLGDLVTILLNGGVLTVGDLIPVGYTNALLTDNKVSYKSNAEVSGAHYVGGFAGETLGSVYVNCDIEKNSTLGVSGTDYVGGFAGDSSNVIISGLLTSLGVDVLGNFPVNSTMLGCDITGNGNLNVTASNNQANTGYAGGFIGRMANSYAVDCSIEGLHNVSGHDYVGGFTGFASTGELIDAETNKDLVNVVRALLALILNGDTNAQLLNLIGLRPSVIAGADISGGNITITANGKYAGGIAGYSGALQIINTGDLNESDRTTGDEIERVINANDLDYSFASNRNSFTANYVNISSTDSAGGAIGRGEMTGAAGVLDGTVTAVNYIRFELRDLDYSGGNVSVSSDNAGGMIGLGIGGEAEDVHATGIAVIEGTTNAGGFGGCFGSGTLDNVGGVNLLGLNVVQIDSLVSISQAIETIATDCSIEGISSGYTVTSTALKGTSGGFIGDCVSGKAVNCSASNLKYVLANTSDGFAGGFAGRAKAGDAVSTIGESIGSSDSLSPLQISNLLGIVSALRPEFHGSQLRYTSYDGDQVSADHAGGFIGYGEAVDVNYSVNHDDNASTYSTSIINIAKVHGYSYAGGFAGKLQPGDIAQTGSIKLLGLLDASRLLTVMDVAYPEISASSIVGAPLEVIADGKEADVQDGDAGGYIGDGKAVIVENSSLSELAYVKAPYHAGGYIGYMHSGTAAEAGDASEALLNGVLGKLLDASELAGVLQAASSRIENCKVTGISEGFYVEAYPMDGSNLSRAEGYAGGYVGEMLSGHIDNHSNATLGSKGTAVENIKYVEGYRYAGGFGGRVVAGAVIELGKDVSVLTGIVQSTDLLTLVNAFVPIIEDASVNSINSGLYVHVTGADEADSTDDPNTGSAGGYIGYANGLQINRSDVNKLKHTKVEEPADLQSDDGSPYYSSDSEYAVKSYKYAGGYFGKLDIGSTESIGGTNVFEKLIDLSSAASALDVVLSIAEDCDTSGAPGGFNVLATNEASSDSNLKGHAGGFAGNILGSELKDCNSYNFSHIIGRVSAGGYVGTAEPGSAADAVEDLEILGGVISVSNIVGVLRAFVPAIINSETTCIPCGGVVRADAPAANGEYKGLAGGYCGYNYGAQIWGRDIENMSPKENAAIRIRSVYGYEYAGGYTGLMRCANVADTGNISVLFNLINIDNPLNVLQAVYPTEENTAVYGPLRQMSVTTWNAWVNAVAKYGPYGEELQAIGEVSDQNELNDIINDYAYGYAVTAGRKAVAETLHEGSAAGGYIGRMEGGTITNGYGNDMRLTEAYRAAGGFAGEMITAGVANVGGVSLAGLDIVGNLPLLETFVPVIKTSSVYGYLSGSVVKATGVDQNDIVGIAGGYVGHMVGGQIWGTALQRIKASNIRSITGTSYVGGFVGRSVPGAAATLNDESKTGLFSKILGKLAASTDDLASVLNATVCTIRYVDVEAWDNYGIVINGAYTANRSVTEYAKAAGGFAGELSGTVVGEDDVPASGFNVKNIRKVIGGEHAGGGYGLSDVASVAQVSAGETSIIDLLKAGSINVIEAFKTYVYYSDVTGSSDAGLYVSARTEHEEGTGITRRYSGNAGGFAGTMKESTVKYSNVHNLAMVDGLNYTGGFAGYMGKGGVVELNELEVIEFDNFRLLGGSLGLIDVFGSTAANCNITGVNDGYSVVSANGSEAVTGGFVGYGDLSRVSNSKAEKIKRVEGDGKSGGFVGMTTFTHGANIQLNSTLVELLLDYVLNPIIEALYLADGTPIDLPELDLGFIKIGLLYKNDLVYLNLFGLPISVSLSKDSETDPGSTDFAVINIGDSVIKLPCKPDDGIENNSENKENIRISLIKANVGKFESCEAKGIDVGYDVYGAQDAGGFVGNNNDTLFENNEMYLCDTIESAENGNVGPFSGLSYRIGHYADETIANIEDDNNYRVYRVSDSADIRKSNNEIISNRKSTFGKFSVYEVHHMEDISEYSEYEGATIGGSDLDVHHSDIKAILMEDVATKAIVPDSKTTVPSAIDDVCDEVRSLTINKVWNMLYADKAHPESIHITVSRTYTIDDTTTTVIVPGYEDYVISGNATASTWQEVIRDLPVYTRDNNDEIVYYHYSVTEAPMAAYTTTIEESNGTSTIENNEKPIAPTGVGSISKFIIMLLLIEALLLVRIKNRSRNKNRVQE